MKQSKGNILRKAAGLENSQGHHHLKMRCERSIHIGSRTQDSSFFTRAYDHHPNWSEAVYALALSWVCYVHGYPLRFNTLPFLPSVLPLVTIIRPFSVLVEPSYNPNFPFTLAVFSQKFCVGFLLYQPATLEVHFQESCFLYSLVESWSKKLFSQDLEKNQQPLS